MRQFQRVNMILDLNSDQLGINNADYLCLIQLTRLSTDKNEVFVSQQALANRLSKTRMSTNTSIQNLAKAGLITINKRTSDHGGRLANSYTLLINKWAQLAGCDVKTLERSTQESLEQLHQRFIKGQKMATIELQRLLDSNILKESDTLLVKALIMKAKEA